MQFRDGNYGELDARSQNGEDNLQECQVLDQHQAKACLTAKVSRKEEYCFGEKKAAPPKSSCTCSLFHQKWLVAMETFVEILHSSLERIIMIPFVFVHSIIPQLLECVDCHLSEGYTKTVCIDRKCA